jgi:hypothetical protein
MIEGTKHVEFADVEVLDYGGPVMCCRVGDRVVWVPALRVLPGTEIKKQGDRGRLVLPPDLAVDLGLAGRFARSFSEDQPLAARRRGSSRASSMVLRRTAGPSWRPTLGRPAP